MILLGIALITAIVYCVLWGNKIYWRSSAPPLIIVLIGTALFIVTGMGVENWYGSSSEIAEFKTIQTTIDQQRAEGISDIERATLTETIISANKWLAYKQFENSTWYGDTVPDEVDNLKPVK